MSRDPGEFLEPAEVKTITGGAAKLDEQQAVLTAEGVPFRVVRNRLIVSRYHVREWLAGRPVVTRRPNLGAVK